MICRYYMWYVILIVIQLYSYVCAGVSSRTIYQEQQAIGKELIAIGHEHSELQSRTYTLLDRVGKLCARFRNDLTVKKNLKKSIVQEQKSVESLRAENKELRRMLQNVEQQCTRKETLLKQKVDEISSLKEQQAQVLEHFTQSSGVNKAIAER